jgi:hypothetical protein
MTGWGRQNIHSKRVACKILFLKGLGTLTEKPRLVGRGFLFPELIIAGWANSFAIAICFVFSELSAFGLDRKFEAGNSQGRRKMG